MQDIAILNNEIDNMHSIAAGNIEALDDRYDVEVVRGLGLYVQTLSTILI
jgi:hypothetical protein